MTPQPRQGRIRDARDRVVTQLDPVTMHLLRRHELIEADVLRAIVKEKGVEIGPAESIVMKDFGTGPFARSASVVYFSIVPWVFWFGLKRARFGRIAAAMLKHGRCPHCGYSLEGLTPDAADGATVCPECGCAWNPTPPTET
jgi:hypothetical protein